MAKIHWMVYVIIGLLISIASYKLNYEKLVFFFYAGVVFIFVGIAKLAFSLIKRKMGKPKAVHQQSSTKFCHQCGTRLALHHKFCTKCGAMA